MMIRGIRGVLLCAAILAAWAAPAHAQAIGSIFGKVSDASGGVLPGVTVTVTGPALQQRKQHLPVPERSDRDLHRHVRARELQKSGAAERRHHDRFQRRRRSET